MIITFRQLLRFSGALWLTVTAAKVVPPARGDGLAVLKGELRQWHKVTLDLAGPFARETDTAPNPFTDYRLTVTFEHESGNPRYAVPGYFAADGNSGETGAEAGNVWRAHLSPDKPGRDNSRYCFAQPGELYLVYLPHGGEATLDLKGAHGAFELRWFNPRDGARHSTTHAIAAGGVVSLRAPDQEDWLAIMRPPEPVAHGKLPAFPGAEGFGAYSKGGGASLPKRDAVDRRIVNDVTHRTGRVITSQHEVGGWPVLPSAPAPKDTDRDGLPDTWEITHGLNPADPTDGNNVGPDGYTLLERYPHKAGRKQGTLP